ncbi:hypothetical protein [Corallococcus exercitus]|uniref:hypothetical protein n=1 Tax=Corallococcus exercitus TaxID=2316736 RepID=UPI0035D40C64
MGRSYSEHPFHQQQPMLGVQGSGPRLGNDEDTQKVAQQKKRKATTKSAKTSASPARQARKAAAPKKGATGALAKGKPAGKARKTPGRAASKRVH